MDVGRQGVTISGSDGITAEGTAEQLSVGISGPGSIWARDLREHDGGSGFERLG